MSASRALSAAGLTLLTLYLPAPHTTSATRSTTPPMRNPVNYFEIPVRDLSRAIAFYEHVFGQMLERTTIDGHAMALFPAVNGAPGVTGALATGDSYVPAIHGTRVYFSVDNIDQALIRVQQRGGRLLYPRTSLGDLGVVAEFEDSEGNRIALHAPSMPGTSP